MDRSKVFFIELKIASKDRYVCEIVEKLYNQGRTVTVFTANEEDALRINDLLWTWKQESFIPHTIAESDSSQEPVLIVKKEHKLPETSSIILHNPLALEKLEKYDLIIDFAEVFHSQKKTESRDRYKIFRDSENYDVNFLQLGAFLSR